MKQKTFTAPLAALAAVGALAVPATAAAAPQVKEFTITPSCIKPGGTVHAYARVFNDRYWFTRTYAQITARYNAVVQYKDEVRGPYPLPPRTSIKVDSDFTLPLTIPPGVYSITAGVGPSRESPQSWSTRTAPLTVSPLCL